MIKKKSRKIIDILSEIEENNDVILLKLKS